LINDQSDDFIFVTRYSQIYNCSEETFRTAAIFTDADADADADDCASSSSSHSRSAGSDPPIHRLTFSPLVVVAVAGHVSWVVAL
jgi:hypothetical protein